MAKKYTLKTTDKKTPEAAASMESYLAPRPPTKGRIIGLDCHPDTFTAAVFVGQTPHDARKLEIRENLGLEALLDWASNDLNPQDIVLLEAGANSFEVCKRLGRLGLRACVLESCHVGKHAKIYADNDRMAAERIALVYLAGNAPCVWVPDEQSQQRRELLHVYQKAVIDHTAATNSIKSYLNCQGIRLGKRSLEAPSTLDWILSQRDWSDLQRQILCEYSEEVAHRQKRRKGIYSLIAEQMSSDPMMLRCMKLLGVGIVSGFALMAVIGDIERFHSPEKLVAYVGLNPGQRQSGNSKNIRLGVGKRGRADIRNLLIQGAQAVLRTGRNTTLGRWGWKLFARKGSRNIAVVAVARKLLVRVWHLLRGNPPTALEKDPVLTRKLRRLAFALGTALRTKLNLGATVADCVQVLRQRAEGIRPYFTPSGNSNASSDPVEV